MKIYYVIRGLVGLGYWNEKRESYSGFIFATQYDDLRDAEYSVKRACKVDFCEIVKVYG